VLLSPCRGSRPRKGDPEWPSQATTLNEHLFDRGANTPHPRRKFASSRYGPGCGPEEVAAVIDVQVENALTPDDVARLAAGELARGG
jgi:hypothetical protein